MIRVLAVASEIFPLVKTGGLADVTGALPLALRGQAATAAPGDAAPRARLLSGKGKSRAAVTRKALPGAQPSAARRAAADVTTMVPGYPAVLDALIGAVPVHRFSDLFGGPATVLRGTAPGDLGAALDLLVVDAPHLYARPGNPYLGPDGREWFDNSVRFAGLGAAAAAVGAGAVPGLAFDIVHAHDWQAAMAIVYLHFHDGPRPGTVMTVHNLAFQGRYSASLFPRLGLPSSAFVVDGLEYNGDVSFLKGGLFYADRITTVSPTYADEITGINDGMGLDGLLRHRAGVLSGILNGIDDMVWNPATDALIPARYARGKVGRRPLNKSALQARMGLKEMPDALLIGVISRLTSQKGLDMLVGQIDSLVTDGAQLALLGSGDPALEWAFAAAAARHPGSIGCLVGYDEGVAHLIQAGSDALLVPSRFEPCGLTQLYALRYGSIPVVARVGGLADTVIDANEAAIAAGVATGIQFWPATPQALNAALHRLLRLWRDRPTWDCIQRNGMSADVSWGAPAGRYIKLFQTLMADRS